LAFHEDIDFSESVEFTQDFDVDEQEIKSFLIDKSLKDF